MIKKIRSKYPTPIPRRKFINTCTTAGSLSALFLNRGTKLFANKQKSSNKPNILLLYSDQHHAAAMGCDNFGHSDVKTPNLDQMAKDGVRFTRAYCMDGISVPSRTCILTGQYPRTTGVINNPDPAYVHKELFPLHQLLKKNGYHTANFGKRHLPKESIRDGFDETATTIGAGWDPSDELFKDWVTKQGYREAYLGDENPKAKRSPLFSHISKLPADKTKSAYTAMKTIEYLRNAAKRKKPFFCWTSFFHPHQPYTPSKKWADLYDPDKVKLPGSLKEPLKNLPPFLQKWRKNKNDPWCGGKAAKNIKLYRNYIAYYYALTTEIDHYIGKIMEELKKLGLEENTIVIYTSDHGDFVGAHGMPEKAALGHNVYEDTLRIPFIMYWKQKFKKGLVYNGLIEQIDLYPTLLELVNIKKPSGFDFPGQSLTGLLKEGKPVKRKYAVSENWSQVTVIGERYKLGVWIDPTRKMKRLDFRKHGDMLFDRKKDPLEMKNLAGKKEVAKVEKEMRAFLKEWEKNTLDKGKKAVLEAYLEKRKTKNREKKG